MRKLLIVVLALSVVCVSSAQTLPVRSPTVVRQFEKLTGYPHGRKGWVVDHIIPLCAGGADAITNMQWQSASRSYQKDGFERALCVAMQKQGYVLIKRSS